VVPGVTVEGTISVAGDAIPARETSSMRQAKATDSCVSHVRASQQYMRLHCIQNEHIGESDGGTDPGAPRATIPVDAGQAGELAALTDE